MSVNVVSVFKDIAVAKTFSSIRYKNVVVPAAETRIDFVFKTRCIQCLLLDVDVEHTCK